MDNLLAFRERSLYIVHGDSGFRQVTLENKVFFSFDSDTHLLLFGKHKKNCCTYDSETHLSHFLLFGKHTLSFQVQRISHVVLITWGHICSVKLFSFLNDICCRPWSAGFELWNWSYQCEPTQIGGGSQIHATWKT